MNWFKWLFLIVSFSFDLGLKSQFAAFVLRGFFFIHCTYSLSLFAHPIAIQTASIDVLLCAVHIQKIHNYICISMFAEWSKQTFMFVSTVPSVCLKCMAIPRERAMFFCQSKWQYTFESHWSFWAAQFKFSHILSKQLYYTSFECTVLGAQFEHLSINCRFKLYNVHSHLFAHYSGLSTFPYCISVTRFISR